MILNANIDNLNMTDNNATNFLRAKALEYINSLKGHIPFDMMSLNTLLMKEYKENIFDIIEKIIVNTSIKHNSENKYRIIINNAAYDDKTNIDSLAKLITFGNLNVKGSTVLFSAYKYAISRI